jgi:hypothetical protein
MDHPLNRRQLIGAGLAALIPALALAQRRDEPWPRGQGLVRRTQEDLRRAEDRAPGHSGKERERFDNARRHLAGFDEELGRRHFDKGRLDEAIGDVQHILDHNRLSDRGREMLQRDVTDLRELRADYDAWRR